MERKTIFLKYIKADFDAEIYFMLWNVCKSYEGTSNTLVCITLSSSF